MLIAMVSATLVSGCVAPGPSRSPAADWSPSPLASTISAPTRASASPAVETGGPSGSTSPTPLVDPPASSVELSTLTVICEDWGSEPPPGSVACDEAASLALDAIGGEPASLVQRLDVRFGDPCVTGGACPRRSDVRTVVARSASFETLLVRVAIDEAGVVRAWPSVEGEREPPRPFAAPRAAAPDLGTDVPPAVRDRPAVAFCGVEDLTDPVAFDTTARGCFLDGVEAWVPVELISRALSTEGAIVTSVYRYAGTGPIQRYVHAPTGWSASGCALSPIATPAMFVLVRPCDAQPLGS